MNAKADNANTSTNNTGGIRRLIYPGVALASLSLGGLVEFHEQPSDFLPNLWNLSESAFASLIAYPFVARGIFQSNWSTIRDYSLLLLATSLAGQTVVYDYRDQIETFLSNLY